MRQEHIKLVLEISGELSELLESVPKKAHLSKEDFLMRSIILMNIALKEKEQGHHLGILEKNNEVLQQIEGI